MTDLPTVRGEFNLLRKIGEGGMAEVFLAERGGDEGFRTVVALKRLHSGFALDQYFIRQLVAEARLLGQLQHDNVVRVHDFRRIEDEYFIVMEYIDGIDLAQAIHVHNEHGLTFPLSVFFHLALCICEALDYAHTATDLGGKPMHLIHRDIKPSNVLISQRGIVKLTDFGIARVADSTHTGSVVKGTANYMSPEQASGEQELTPASDIFSLGAVFWETLTLEKLVDGSNYLNVIDSIKGLNVGLKDITRRGIEPALRMILLRMLAHKRELRYQSMSLVLKDLRFVAEQMKVDLSPAHLQEYMTRIIKLARESAVRHADMHQIAAASKDPTPATPVPAPTPPPAKAPAKAADADTKVFSDSVAALQELVQTGSDIPPVSPPGDKGPKASPQPRSAGSASVAPPSAAPPSAPALRAVPEFTGKVAAPEEATEKSRQPASGSPPPLVKRNTKGGPSAPLPVQAPGPGPGRVSAAPSPAAAPQSFSVGPKTRPFSGDEDGLEGDTQGDWEADNDEEDYFRARRRANIAVLAIGVPAVLILLGVIVVLLVGGQPGKVSPTGEDPGVVGSETEVVISPDVPGEEEEGTQSLPGGAVPEEPEEFVVEAGAALVEGGWDSPVEGPGETGIRRSPDPEPRNAAGLERPPPERMVREDSWDAPAVDSWVAPVAQEEAPAGREEPADPEPEDGWVPGAGPGPGENDWVPEPEQGDRDVDWAVAGDVATANAAPSDDPPLSTTNLGDMATFARRGSLSESQLASLDSINPDSALYNTGRALLLAHFEANRNTRAHCEVAVETLRQPANRAAPQFHLEMSKCHLRQGRHQDALESARVAELNAQDIPARVRADRQLKIWEVQAKAFKGMYQSTDDLDYIADSIAVWKRYQHMARNTYRQRESDRAEKEIRSLKALQAGAL